MTLALPQIDVVSWTNIFVAITTLFLAIITSKTIDMMKKQQVFLHKQTLLSASNQNPLLEIINFRFKENQLFVKVHNSGNGNAHDIGLVTKFYPVEPKISEIRNNKPFGYFNYDSSKLVDDLGKEKHIIINNGYVNFPQDFNQRFILKSNQTKTLKFNCVFFVNYKMQQGTIGRALEIKKMVDLLNKNGKNYASFSFNLVCRNAVDDFVEEINVTKFIFVNKEHKTLEDAQNSKYKSNIEALSQNEVETLVYGQIYDFYVGGKSLKNFIPNEDKIYKR